jgi:DNA mismatch endonuclease (patch repair protein)
MVDRISEEKRSWNMSRIKGSDTKPEIIVRSFLHRQGLRFRVNDKNLPGKPDIVLKKYRTIVFVDGCFWHRHTGCRFAYTPKSRIEFWTEKFKSNVKRDRKVNTMLKEQSWNVVRIWQCETKTSEKLSRLTNQITNGVE